MAKSKNKLFKSNRYELSYEVDYKVENMSLSLSKRQEHLKKMLEELEKKQQAGSFTGAAASKSKETEPYFYLGMQENPKARW